MRTISNWALAHVLLAGMLAAGCSDATAPKPAVPFAAQSFDPRLPSVQLTRVYYNEVANQQDGASLNEYFVLQSRDTTLLHAYSVRVGPRTIIPLGDVTVPRMLTVYVRSEPDLPPSVAMSLHQPTWLFQNDHDTVTLLDDHRLLVSEHRY